MCIRIVYKDAEVKYDSTKPLEEQLYGSERVVIRYEPKDADINRFTDEVERLCKNGISLNTNVKVIHNDNLKGIKAKKLMDRLRKDLDLNEAIKILVNLQSETNKKLEEMASFCKR